jgi:transposase
MDNVHEQEKNHMAYSNDLRERILAAVNEGTLRQAEILRIFKISRTGFNYFIKHVRETGSIERQRFGMGRPSKFDTKDIARIKRYLSTHPDATLQEILDFTGKNASIMSVHRTLKKIGYKLKKSPYSPVSRKGKMLKPKEPHGRKE